MAFDQRPPVAASCRTPKCPPSRYRPAPVRGGVHRLAPTLAEEAMLGALLGFAAFLLVPVAVGLAILTFVGLPVGLGTIAVSGPPHREFRAGTP